MSEANSCPYCGCPQSEEASVSGVADRSSSGASARAMDALCREVQRIREIAENRTALADTRRIEELTAEVQHLRATVARLRGSSNGMAAHHATSLPRPAA